MLVFLRHFFIVLFVYHLFSEAGFNLVSRNFIALDTAEPCKLLKISKL